MTEACGEMSLLGVSTRLLVATVVGVNDTGCCCCDVLSAGVSDVPGAAGVFSSAAGASMVLASLNFIDSAHSEDYLQSTLHICTAITLPYKQYTMNNVGLLAVGGGIGFSIGVGHRSKNAR